jgi:hypothetical protein
VPDEPRPQRDEHRRGELEEEADPDREALDRDEIEPLDEREPDDPVEDEQRDLVPPDPQTPGRRGEHERRQAEERPRRPELGQPQVRDAALGEDDLRDVPLTAKSADAAATIAYPSRGCGAPAAGRRAG